MTRKTKPPVSPARQKVTGAPAPSHKDSAIADPGTIPVPDPVELGEAWLRLAGRGQDLMAAFLKNQSEGTGDKAVLDPFNVSGAMVEMGARLMTDPTPVLRAGADFWHESLRILEHTALKLRGVDAPPVVMPARGDRRFQDAAWDQNAIFDFIKQSYLLTSRTVQKAVKGVDGLDPHTARKLDFITRQFVDAVSPSNFALTNPEVLRKTAETGGENLVQGVQNLLKDLERGQGRLRITMTDENAFKVGENVAATPGQVVFQNDMMQLIQYAPVTETVYRTPLLIISPWINKFYILDLRPDNSFIRNAVENGHTVFVVSWVNPDAKLAEKTFENYMTEGALAALDAIERATGEKSVNVVGYCLGGTLLACTLAYNAVKKDNRVKSATYLVTMIDFKEAGDLGVFIDDEQLEMLDHQMQKTGFLPGGTMAATFNMLRANDLIWSFVVNNYLLGREPFPFDLLYWNADSTRMPRAMQSFYLRAMYQQNLLCQPGGIKLCGVPIDLSKIKTPSFLLSTKEDHISPWKSTYAATKIYGGNVEFVLSGSGHIAGVINPPAAKKYGYWTNSDLPISPELWMAGAEAHEGSWWTHWMDWLKPYAGGKVPARVPGDGKLKVIEPAPGRYVKVRAV
jgi:polyhydroxyalkanoate synthase subunit PhaC